MTPPAPPRTNFGEWLLAERPASPAAEKFRWFIDLAELDMVQDGSYFATTDDLYRWLRSVDWSENDDDAWAIIRDDLIDASEQYGDSLYDREDALVSRFYHAGWLDYAPFIGLYERDEYLPTRQLSWLVSWEGYGSGDWWHCKEGIGDEPPTPNHRLWFAVMSDQSGHSFPVWYPQGAAEGEEITVFVNRTPVKWRHGTPGLTEWEIEPLISDWLVMLGALLC